MKGEPVPLVETDRPNADAQTGRFIVPGTPQKNHQPLPSRLPVPTNAVDATSVTSGVSVSLLRATLDGHCLCDGQRHAARMMSCCNAST
ncbi:hypothetical protein FOMPIDRAFT_1026429 [Fomitopsis schrenkii]|uniref:Uncharacterized protein n=1 Tax=Fomitopsis schrenkii TaxID=2126942 RepID=S8F484_FOMSC|nr:hypothetical protein FOMPIDRAFT_1026429 [Fomitopsis schrenkii]